FADFASIDFASHEQEIEALQLERTTLEGKNNAIRVLKKRFGESESREKAFQASRDDLVGTERQLKSQIDEGERLIANARRKLDSWQQKGAFAQHATCF